MSVKQTKMTKQETFQVGDHVHLAHVNGGGTGVFGKVLRFLDGGRSVEVQSDFGGLFGPRTFYGPTSRLTKADCQGTT